MAWHNSSYKYRKKITILYTKVSGDEIDYPMVYSVTDNDLKDKANGGGLESSSGFDIIFYSNEGVHLYHETELYTNTTGNLVVWVRVPSISSTSNTFIYIYYGNPNITTDQSSTDVWISDFKMVQHMDDVTTSTTDDSTSYNNNGTKVSANKPIEATGKISKGQDFNAAGHDYINCGKDASIIFPTHSFTISVWVKTPSVAYYYIVDGAHDWTASPTGGWSLRWRGDSYDEFSLAIYSSTTGGGSTTISTSSGYSDVNEWYYVTGVYTYVGAGTSKLDIYVDGISAATQITNAKALGATTKNSLCIGIDADGYDSGYYDGIIDEVQLSDSVRSANWINTTWNNQNAPTTFSITGGKESLNAFISGLVSLNTTLESNKLINSLDSGVIGNNLLSCRTINQVQ